MGGVQGVEGGDGMSKAKYEGETETEREMRINADIKFARALANPVTCDECLYCAEPKGTLWCAKFGAYKPSADGFCAWGERRRA